MDERIGTCSICGGPVVVPSFMVNPTPHCTECGAIAKRPHGPVIPMEPSPLQKYRQRYQRDYAGRNPRDVVADTFGYRANWEIQVNGYGHGV